MMKQVCVIGACGRVGLPFSLYLAYKGYWVMGYDRNPKAVERIDNGFIDFVEDDLVSGPPNLMLAAEKVHFTCSQKDFEETAGKTDVYVVMIGTPVDSENNPRIDGLIEIIDHLARMIIVTNLLKPLPAWKPLIILRSTVSPHTTDMLRAHIANNFSLYEAQHYLLAFCPERISQGHSMIELPELPQLIGTFGAASKQAADEFFSVITPNRFHMDPVDAELGKLMTNMYRYVNFALANEFMMLCEDHGVDFEKLRVAINSNYPRMHLEKAGPNVAGPCLYKDGQFLVSGVAYSDIIRTSFTINEGMPEYIFRLLEEESQFNIGSTIGILGLAFKANNDDTRHSLAYKMQKVLKRRGYKVIAYDPYVTKDVEPTILAPCDAFILMTPHDVFDDEFLERYLASGKSRDSVLMIDLWRHFTRSNDHMNGIYWI